MLLTVDEIAYFGRVPLSHSVHHGCKSKIDSMQIESIIATGSMHQLHKSY